MTLVFPTAEDLRAEPEDVGSDDVLRDSKVMDTAWSFTFKDVDNVDPADLQGV